jgi:hypothetical protein
MPWCDSDVLSCQDIPGLCFCVDITVLPSLRILRIIHFIGTNRALFPGANEEPTIGAIRDAMNRVRVLDNDRLRTEIEGLLQRQAAQ